MKRLYICKRSFLLLGCIIVLTLVSDGITQNQLPGIGAMGDSLTDEYQTDEYLSGLCWVEQLVKSRGLDFGAFSSTSRGEPRRYGYEYNWARYGAKANGNSAYDLPSQWAGLANQVIEGKVTYVYLGIGSNDFGPVGNYGTIALGNLVGSDLEAFIDSVVGRIEVALDEVCSTNDVRLILSNIPDNGVTPPTQRNYNEEQRARVTDAIKQANNKILAIANQRVIPVIDIFGLGNLSLHDSLTIGGVLINTKGASNDPHNFLLSDGAHPGTVVQGMLANAFIEAINRAYRADIEPLSDQEILANAGIPDPNPGANPTYFDISGFVLDPTAPSAPRPDFNSDGIVDAVDMCIMIDHWGEDYSLCDISPMPWGDGIVDVQDLIVLAEHLFEDYRLVAHWALDEEMGNIAYDSVGENYGTLQGEPLWQPTEGKIDGALQFDGIDDYVVTGSILNPADGDFSVFVWVKGDTPGQVILSQASEANWLCTDLVEGCLMTQLQPAGRGGAPLLSNTCITDNDWHRIGFVWDGSYRYLYVDGEEVANDAAQLSSLLSADNGLFLGAGCYREPGTFFSGLIDDVRIYNRVVSP
ncbi:LamG-like jellyroll fold domain-containing protein [Planctomycetota bacterium]